MYTIINLGKILNSSDFDKYIIEAEKLDTIVHKYGTTFNIPNSPCWMKYDNEGGEEGSISFTRHTYDHPILKEMVEDIIKILTPFFPKNNLPNKNRIHLVKTIKSIFPHVDESGRLCCINIGIKNASSAETFISSDGVKENFYHNREKHVLKDGYGYLVNTSQYHSVTSSSDIPRYLITYGFGVPIDVIIKNFNIPNLEI